LVVVSSCIYRVNHTRKGALIGLLGGTLSMGVVMMIANHFVTPLFMGVPTAVVDAMLLPVILPFNLVKAGINSTVTFALYKTVSRFLIHGEPARKTDKLESNV
jgi:riboflavin transporter FmnP